MKERVMELFPYEPRPNQEDIMESVYSCLEEGRSMVYQAATGSGKTICTLTPVLEYAKKHDKRVIYLTRTNSQQKQVIHELRKLKGFYGIGLQGRNNTCLLALDDEELKKGSPDELSKYCSDRKKEVREAMDKSAEEVDGEEKENKDFSCPYYAGLMRCKIPEVREWAEQNIPTADEFLDYCVENELCAYELSKALIPQADLVTAPYIYFFQKFIRKRLLEWMDAEMEDLIVIVDEAHNLPGYARELASGKLSNITMERAVSEGMEFGDPELKDNTTVTSLSRLMSNILLDMVDEFVVDEDGLLPPNELKAELLHSLGMNTNDLKSAIKDLKLQGELVQQQKREEKELPRSYIYSLAEFLSFWISVNRAEYIKLINGGDNPSWEGFCLDPSNLTEALNYTHASIHQSATLEPLEEYKDSLGLPHDAETEIYPSPFPKENMANFYMKGVTTQYDALTREEGMIDKIRKNVSDILKNVRKNIIVFFPSYNLMDEIGLPLVDKNDDREHYIEGRGMTQPELMEMVDEFKETGGVLFSVIGGRISEGMDFPGDELEVAVVVGIPYPKPTARQRGLQHYYDMKFNKGWEYTVKAPAVRKILQATGRLVRSEDDLGAAVILDGRAMHFKQYIDDLMLTEDPVKSMQSVFHE